MEELSYELLLAARRNIVKVGESSFAHSFISPIAHIRAFYSLADLASTMAFDIPEMDVCEKQSLVAVMQSPADVRDVHTEYIDELAKQAHRVIRPSSICLKKVIQKYHDSLHAYANMIRFCTNKRIRALHSSTFQEHASALVHHYQV